MQHTLIHADTQSIYDTHTCVCVVYALSVGMLLGEQTPVYACAMHVQYICNAYVIHVSCVLAAKTMPHTRNFSLMAVTWGRILV